jgi:aspartate dehydrogenase
MTTHRVVVIGFGAIGGDLVAELAKREAPAFTIAVALPVGSRSRERVPKTCEILSTAEEIRAFGPDLVVEAAGHEAVATVVPACLGLGLPVLISSIGALHDDALYAMLVEAARRYGGRLILPSGALGGTDYVRAVRGARDLRLAYESRKPPSAWKGELERLGHDPDRLESPLTLLRGTAREAAAAYPQNLNVAATLALAGPGFEATQVSVVCDPAARGNTHIIQAESEFGTMRAEIANRPSPVNPKTSWIVGRSLIAAIDQHFSPVVML